MKTVLAASAGLIALVTLTGAAPEPMRAAQAATLLPVLTATQRVETTISACMYAGARPETYQVVFHSCRGGASQCTAWVLMRSPEEIEMLTAGFDLTNPPVEATGPTCDRPMHQPTGTLSAPPR